MPIITFTEDVTLTSEAPGTGPHYRKGYCVDVPEKIAQGWVAKGVAVYGQIETPETVVEETPAPVAVVSEPEPEAETPVETPTPRPSRRRRRRGWSPLDEND